jgi:hypothetical protein
MATGTKGRSAMLATLHRFFDHLFHGQHAAHPRLMPPGDGDAVPVRPGFPDAYHDKLPPAEERHGDQHYTLDPVSHHFVETPASHEQP